MPTAPIPEAILTIAGVDYDAESRAANHLVLGSLTLTFEGYDALDLSEHGCGPKARFKAGLPVSLSVGGIVRFRGRIASVGRNPEEGGWVYSYRFMGLKELADGVSVRDRDGSGGFDFNLPPDDDQYVASQAGLPVGEMVKRALCVPGAAQALAEVGVGGFTGLPDSPELPAETLADLAELDVVPHVPVWITGRHLINNLEELIQRWHPRFRLHVRASDGVIRVRDVLALPPRPLVVPGDSGFESADPVEWPRIDSDIKHCFTAVRVLGVDLATTVLSLRDETLVPAWTEDEEEAWRLKDFTEPRDASDRGNVSDVTLTSVSVASDDATAFWVENFWNLREGVIYLINDAIDGAEFSEARPITSCTALSPGGSSTITWDSALPLSSTTYNRYRIEAKTGPMALVGRAFFVHDKATGNTGLDTYVGSHLASALFPNAVPFGTSSAVMQIRTPMGAVTWSLDGSLPGYNAVTVPITVDSGRGMIIAREPIVFRSASESQLIQGYPQTYAQGLPTDFKAVVLYNRGSLSVRVPETGYAGRGFEENGIERTWEITEDNWTWVGDRPKIAKLAEEQAKAVRDPFERGSVLCHGHPAGFDPLDFGYSLSLSMSDGTESDWDGIEYPVRSVTVTWPERGPDLMLVRFDVDNAVGVLSGDSLGMHSRYGGGAALGYSGGEDDYFSATALSMPSLGALGGIGGGFAAGGLDFAAGPEDGYTAFRPTTHRDRSKPVEIRNPFAPEYPPTPTLVDGPMPPRDPRPLSERRGFVPPAAAPAPPPLTPAATKDNRPLSERRRSPRPHRDDEDEAFGA